VTRLEHGPCGRCGRDVIGGWSGTGQILSVQVTVDAAPIPGPEQELRWLAVAGCRTWTLHAVAAQLHPRSARTIRLRPAGTRPRQTVHPEHRCTPPAERTRP
jgi:hypothetical protein